MDDMTGSTLDGSAGGPVDDPPAGPPAGAAHEDPQEPLVQAEEEGAAADVIRRLRERGLGGLVVAAGGVAGFGPGDAAGTINKHYYNAAPQPDPVDGRIPDDDLDRLRERYVEPASHGVLRRHLARQGVAVLRGSSGSGRCTTALLVAQEVMDAGVVVLDPEADLRRLLKAPQEGGPGGLQPHRGHVVEGDGRPWASVLRAQLMNRLREVTYRRSPLVVVVDDQVPVDGLEDHVVEHRTTDDMPLRVLERHLTVLLAERPEECRKLLDHDALREELRGHASMAETARVAGQVARGVLAGEDTDQIVQGLRARLRARAERLLRPPSPAGDGAAGKPEVSLWSRAFLLACVVLDGMPLSRVSRESHRLAELLHGVRSPASVPEMPLFQESLQDWLDHSDVEFSDRDGHPVEARHPECRVRVRQRGLAEAVLEVLWHDHSGARGPLLEWLDGLVVGGEEDVRVSASQTAGLLASFDWAYVQEELLVRWATDRGEHAERRRFAAAWALERAVTDDVLAPRVRRLLRGWSRRRDFQLCALAAYGTRIGALFPAEALDNLERIAQSRAGTVRAAVREIYAAGSRPQALERLADWSLSPHHWLRQDAALCLQQLSRFRGDLAVTGFLKQPAARGHLLRLTRNVLLSHDHTIWQRGWDTVRLWVERAGDEPGLDEVLAAFLTELPPEAGRRPDGLRERIVFYLRLWEHQGVGVDAAARISALVTERWSM
ncbi:hypothetical protein ACF1G0_02290 [Streptomyces sp. NPDC013953]|uniref:hypothetical protein n=1 Tax=Streptomyces sp. NPDC013953 TaxID=3364868 RepID=UPI0036FD575B